MNVEYAIAGTTFGLTRCELARLARTGVRYSFADAATKSKLSAEIDAVASAPVADR